MTGQALARAARNPPPRRSPAAAWEPMLLRPAQHSTAPAAGDATHRAHLPAAGQAAGGGHAARRYGGDSGSATTAHWLDCASNHPALLLTTLRRSRWWSPPAPAARLAWVLVSANLRGARAPLPRGPDARTRRRASWPWRAYCCCATASRAGSGRRGRCDRVWWRAEPRRWAVLCSRGTAGFTRNKPGALRACEQ